MHVRQIHSEGKFAKIRATVDWPWSEYIGFSWRFLRYLASHWSYVNT